MKIALRNLTKTFQTRVGARKREIVAVDDFSLEVPSGSLMGLLGSSGCGKSTILHMICGLIKPTGGRIFFGDEDVTDIAPEHRGVGMVFQNYALYPHLTVRQNILFPLQNLRGRDRLSKAEMLRRSDEIAALVSVREFMERKPKELSGGQQQRVAIARALVKSPRVLLLDEPLSNLDARLRLQTREEIRRIQRATGITTIFVTHDQEEAMSVSDSIAVMNEGRVRQTGRPQEVYDDPNSRFVARFLGTPPISLFSGAIEGGVLYLGGDAVLRVSGCADQRVSVGIRPEGFVLSENGVLRAQFHRVEVMGRDMSVIAAHAACEKPTFRAIVSADAAKKPSDSVRFDLLPRKVFLFRAETGERVPACLEVLSHGDE